MSKHVVFFGNVKNLYSQKSSRKKDNVHFFIYIFWSIMIVSGVLMIL